MNLHSVPQIEGPRVYCGPTAISGVTGVPPGEVVWTIQRLRGDFRRPVVAIDDYEVCNVLGYLGYMATFRHVTGPGLRVRLQSYFADWVGNHRPCIASLTNHYVATNGTEALCNQTQGKPVCLLVHPYARAYLQGIIHVRARR